MTSPGLPPPERGRAREAEDRLVYRSQLCRYRAQNQALSCCIWQLAILRRPAFASARQKAPQGRGDRQARLGLVV